MMYHCSVIIKLDILVRTSEHKMALNFLNIYAQLKQNVIEYLHQIKVELT